MRVYHDEDGLDPERLKLLCDVQCNNTHVDLCYIGAIPGSGDHEGSFKRAVLFLEVLSSILAFRHRSDPLEVPPDCRPVGQHFSFEGPRLQTLGS